eukprot:CAMPEP_0178928732 /NCGR_PEP_ID=MMETSP0786-20121207/20106_1 /TAXON_ID=186022 /ORGANISM="Thalassionema frauenfeldii, Strain CCMP 1798" /LENGTH=132 /DNA_ID=CAMNT_0020604707 /DNA_START=194 /DNA_END=589 /DNA_ORIENTATION=+
MSSLYQVGPYDVICKSRTRKDFDHVGNRRFRIIIENHCESYDKAKTKSDKSAIVLSIIRSIRNAGGNFIRRNRRLSCWEMMPLGHTKEKIGHALRHSIIAKAEAGEIRKSHRTISDVIGGGRKAKSKNETKN